MIFNFIKRLFGKREASPTHQDSPRLESDSLDSSPTRVRLESDSPDSVTNSGIFLEKESVQLGLAAGYTSHLIQSIESSLNRIESLMVTKDWFEHKDKSTQLLGTLELIKTILESHDRKTEEKFDKLHNALLRLLVVAKKVPEPFKSELRSEIEKIEAQLPLSSRMNVILLTIKERGEISYKELTSLLGYKTVDSLRSYLSKMKRRGAAIETFTKNNEKWVRLKSRHTESTSQRLESDSNLPPSNLLEKSSDNSLFSLFD